MRRLTGHQRLEVAVTAYVSESSIRRWERDPDSVSENVRLRIEEALVELKLEVFHPSSLLFT